MNQKSLMGLKNLVSEFIKNPKLIDKLDDIRIRYAEITEKLEDPNTYKDRKLSEKLNKSKVVYSSTISGIYSCIITLVL